MERVPPEGERTQRDRGIGIRQVLSILLSAVVLVLIVVNTDEATLDLLFGEVKAPLWLIIAIAALVGAVIGFLVGRRRDRRERD